MKNDKMRPVQGFAFGGIANPTQRATLRASDREYLGERQRELDAFEAQRLAYNDALTKYQTEVYNPYQAQFDAYQKAVDAWNAGPRDQDYSGPAAPTLPSQFKMTAPVLPFDEAKVVERQKQAAQTARKDAANRATAISVVSDPDRFGFGSLSIADRFMAEGGFVEKRDNSARGQLAEMTQRVASAGRGGDQELAYLSSSARDMLKRMGSAGTVNPATGLPEFFETANFAIGDELSEDAIRVFKQAQAAAAAQVAQQDPAPVVAQRKPVQPSHSKPPSVKPGDAYYESPEYKAYVEKYKVNDPFVARDAAIHESPYFGFFPSSGLGRGMDEAYETYLARLAREARNPAPSPAPTPIPVMPPVVPTPIPVMPPVAGPPIAPTPVPRPVFLAPLDINRDILRNSSLGPVAGAGTASGGSVYQPMFNNQPAPSLDSGSPIPIVQPSYVDYTSRGIGTAQQNLAMPLFGAQPAGGAGTGPQDYVSMMNQQLSARMLGGIENAGVRYDRLGNPILAPVSVLDGMQNAGVRYDRLGNPILASSPLLFAKGGEVSAEDEDDEEGVGEVGSAKALLAQLEGQEPASEKKKTQSASLKRMAMSGGAAMPKPMDMSPEALASTRELVAMAKDKGTAKEQMAELARLYQLRAATFNQPTLSEQTFNKNTLAARRFKEGGEAKKGKALPTVMEVRGYATEASERLFPDQGGQDDQRDAARHMLAGAALAKRYGPNVAKLLGLAHEYSSNPQTFFSGLGIGQPRDDFEYDEHNNRVGMGLASRATSREALEALVREMAAKSSTEKREGLPYIMSQEKVDARAAKAAKGPAPRPQGYQEGGEVTDPEAAMFAGRGDVPAKPNMTNQEFLQQALYGVGDLPYVVAGAPVDLAAMVMAPFGYKDDKPFMGSADIKARMTRAGIRPADATDPRLQGPRMASELLASLTNPAAVSRKVGPAVEKGVKAGAREVGRQLDRAIMDETGPLAKVIPQAVKPMYISRSPGGYFPTSRVEGGILSKLDEALDPVLKKAREVEDPEKRAALTQLFNQKAKDFYTKQAGSIQDPLRQDILSGNLKFELGTPMGDKFPRFAQKSVAQGDLEALRALEKNYDEMVGIRSTVPRRQNTPVIDNVMEAQIIANMQANLDKIPDAQLVAYTGKKPVDIPAQAAEIRQKIKDNPTLFSTVLEPRIAQTLFPESRYYTDSDMARYPEMYGGAAAAAMRVREKRTPEYGEEVPPGFFLPEMEAAIEKGQPIMDVRSPRMLGMDPEKMLVEAQKMPTEELSQMSFPDFLKKAYVNTQALDQFEKQIPKVKKMIQDGKAPPADVMTYGVQDFLPMPDKTFRWVKVVKPDAVKAIAAGMDNSVASYASSTVYGALKKGRAALESGEAEVYALYDKNNVPHMTMEYLTSKPGVPDDQKNTIAQLTGNGPLTKNEVPEKYASQIVELLNRIQPNRIPTSIKRLLEETGQKAFLTDEAMAPLYFGVPIQSLRGGDDDLLQQLGAP